MRDALKGMIIGICALALLGAIATRLGLIVPALPRPRGTDAWMLSRATGLLAYVVLGIDVIIGLLISTRRGDRLVPRAALVDIHGWLSPLALAFVLAHGALLLADDYVRFDAIDIAIPFMSSRWPAAIGIGVLAAYFMVVVHLSFALRKRIGVSTWRRIHYLSFVVFVLTTVHAISIGTDRGSPVFVTAYALALVVVAMLAGVRLREARRKRRQAMT